MSQRSSLPRYWTANHKQGAFAKYSFDVSLFNPSRTSRNGLGQYDRSKLAIERGVDDESE